MLKVVSPTAARRWLGAVDRCCAHYTHKRLSPTMALTSSSAPLGSRGYSDATRLQFPPLPKEWAGHYKPGQMFSEQDSLPHLPVPPLQQTLERYLNCVQPLLSEDEFQKTREVVREFGREGGAGEGLQKRLYERAKTRDSWLLEWWNHVAYLGYRLPVVVYSNPAIGFPRQLCGNREQYVRTAAWFMLGLVKWNMLIQNKAIPVDRYRGKPMCMHHYQLYSKCRIPGPTADTVRATPVNESRHVLVIRNGHFYRLDVLYETADGMLAVCPPAHIISELNRILDVAPPTNNHPVGILTNEHRETWYKARERLREDQVNCASLDDIETAILSISLDKAHPSLASVDPGAQFNDHQRSLLASNLLHGNGSQLNSTNRWSDICIQVSLSEDGSLGSMLEHTGGDGPPAIAADIFLLTMQKLGYDVLAESSPVPTTSLKPAQLLEWNLSADSAQDIQTAIVNNDKLCDDVDLKVAIFNEFGKDVPKKFNLSPDGFIQTAIQLAYWKLYGKTTAMYESGATRWFKYGRTDTIRSVSNTSRSFLQAMSDPSASAQEKADLLVASVKAHSDYTNQAISGQAPDRHLLGLRLAASEAGMDPLPSIFTDPAYSKSLHFQLSTSQVPVADFDLILCFGAVVPDGYGVCYNPQQGKTLLGVSCYHSCPDTDSGLFLVKLQEGLREMRDVMETVTPPIAKL